MNDAFKRPSTNKTLTAESQTDAAEKHSNSLILYIYTYFYIYICNYRSVTFICTSRSGSDNSTICFFHKLLFLFFGQRRNANRKLKIAHVVFERQCGFLVLQAQLQLMRIEQFQRRQIHTDWTHEVVRENVKVVDFHLKGKPKRSNSNSDFVACSWSVGSVMIMANSSSQLGFRFRYTVLLL